MTTTTKSNLWTTEDAEYFIRDKMMDGYFYIIDDFVSRLDFDNEEERDELRTFLEEQTIVSVKVPERPNN